MKEVKISDKIDHLKQSVDWFYGEDFVLEEATEKYREALGLAKEIEHDLDEMKNEIEIIDKDFSRESVEKNN